MCSLPETVILMRIEFGEAGDGEMKVIIAASGKGRLNTVTFIVFVRCMILASLVSIVALPRSNNSNFRSLTAVL
jgi:hypothetical protein